MTKKYKLLKVLRLYQNLIMMCRWEIQIPEHKIEFSKYDQIDPDIILFTEVNKKITKFKTSRSQNIILNFNDKHQLIEINKKSISL